MIAHPTRERHSRSAFTLVEMLVVVAILAVLAALAAGGIFGWIDAQRRSNTEQTITTVHARLQQQMTAVLKKADTETVPPSVLGIAGGDQQRARVLWKKFRLRQEFPMTKAEALAPHFVSATVQIPATDLPPVRVYALALAKVTPSAATESSALLLMALQRSVGGGEPFNPDTLAHAIADTDNDGLKELVDGWGVPLAFFRHPTGHAELWASNPAAAGSRAGKFGDPLDPDGRLLEPTWYGVKTPTLQRQWVEAFFHQISPDNGTSAYFIMPVIASAGKNGQLGLAAGTMAIASPQEQVDNIYSFRLKLGSTGTK